MKWFAHSRRSFNSINRKNRQRLGKAASQVAAKAMGRSEGLESRRMLVNYTGTAGPDNFLIQVGGGNVTVTINGVPDIRTDAAVATIVIDALGGNDTVTLLNNDATNPTTINAGDGDDSIVIGAPGGGSYSTTIDSTVVVTDGTGTADVLVFNDLADAAGNDTYDMVTTDRSLVKPTSAITTWAGMNSVIVNGSPIASIYNVATNVGSGGVTLNGGGAADTFNVGGTLDLGNEIDTSVSINGGLGADVVVLDDTAELTATTYTLDANGLGSTSMGGSIRIGFSSITSMTLNGAPGALADTYNITDLNGVTNATLNAGDGNDTVNYGSATADINAVDANITFNAQAGTDVINWNAQAAGVANTLTVTASTVDSTITGVLTYSLAESILVTGSDTLADTYNVNSTLSTTPITVNGGDGNDIFNVGNGDVDSNLNARVSIVGGAGTDLLTYNDTTDGVGSDTLSMFTNAIAKGAGVTHFWSSSGANQTENIVWNGSDQGDTMTSTGATLNTSVTVNAGLGNDTMTLGNAGSLDATNGTFLFLGGTGTDVFNIDDAADNTVAETYTFNGIFTTLLTRTNASGAAGFDLSTEAVTLDVGNGGASVLGQSIVVNAISDNTFSSLLTINAGDGNDTVTIGGGSWGGAVLRAVSVNGGAGTDRVVINDSLSTLADTYTFLGGSATSVNAQPIDAISWNNLTENIELNAGGLADVIDITSVLSTEFITVNGGAGNDTVNASTANDIDLSIQGDFSFFGGADNDLFSINDTGDTADADNYTVNASSFVKSNMPTGDLFWNSTTDRITVTGNAGNGTYTVGGVLDGISLTVNAGGGNDLIQNDAGNNFSSDWEDASVVLSGGGGNDTLDLDDTASTTATYGIDNNRITTDAAGANGPVSAFYDLLETFTFLTNSVASTINAVGLDNEIDNFTLNGGDGNDTINVGGATGADLDGLNFFGQATNISINGGLGTDSLVIRDTDAVVGDDTYQLTQSAFTVAFGSASPTVFNYSSDVDNIRLIGSDIAHTWNIESTFSTTNVILDGGAAADTINLAPISDDLASIDAPMTLRGNDGTDVLTLHDSLNATNATWSILNNNLQRTGDFFAGLGYNTLEQINIDAGTAVDTFNVSSLFAGVGLDLDGRNGDDVFNIASSNNMNLVDGDISVIGNAGTDSLFYSDTLNAAATTYTMGGAGSQRITRSGAGTVAVSTLIENVTVSTGSGNNVIDIDAWSLFFPNRPTILAGTGNDSITVGNGDYDTNIGTPVFVNTGAGNDTLVFDDATDNDTGDTYTLTSSSITDSGAAANVLSYDAFFTTDTVVLLLPGGAETVTVNSSITGVTSISGGAGNDTVNAGGGDLDLLNGTLIVDGGADSDRFNLDNSADPVAGTNTIDIVALSPTLGQLTNTDDAPIDIAQWTNTVEVVAVTDGSANTTFNVTSLPTPVRTSINGGDGNDTFNAGGGDIDLNLAGGIGPIQRFEGGNGTDILNFDDSADDAGGDNMIIRSSSIDKNGQVVNYGTMEAMTLAGSPQPTSYSIESTNATTPVTINGGGAADLFNVGGGVGGGDIDLGILGSVTINGGAGEDTLNYNDVSDTADADSYTFNTGDIFFKSSMPVGVTVDANNVQNTTLNANNGSNIIQVNNAPASLSVNANGGDDDIRIDDGGTSAAPVVVTSGAGTDTIQVDNDGDANDSFVRFAGTDEVGRMVVGTGSTLQNGPGNSTMIVTGSIGLSGSIDVASGFFISRVGVQTLAVATNRVGNGFNAGAWNGVSLAIRSSTANASARPDGVGIRLATDPNLAGANVITFGGQAVNPGDVLMAYVQDGDTDLDRDVDFDDLLRNAQSFGLAGPRAWTQGNFDYDNDVDFDDLLKVAQNFGLPFLKVSTSDSDIASATSAFVQASQQRGIPMRASRAMQSVAKAIQKDESVFTSAEAIA